jgi:hypothetical protein
VDRSWEYVNRSHTHERGRWDCGRAIPFLGMQNGIFVAVCLIIFEMRKCRKCVFFGQLRWFFARDGDVIKGQARGLMLNLTVKTIV